MGFIGSYITDELLRRGHRVRVFDNLDPQVHPTGALPEYARSEVEFVRGDVRDYEAFRKALDGIEVVYHKAAAVGMGQSQYEIKRYVDCNISGTANLLDLLVNHQNRVEKVVIAASQSSYGEGAYHCDEHGPQRPGLRPAAQLERQEWEAQCPVCGGDLTPVPIGEEAERICYAIYAMTKMSQEDMVLNIGRTYRIPSVALRYFNVFGPRQSLSNPYTGVTAIFMSRIKNGSSPVIYEDGNQSRDFISVHDIVQANMLAMERPEADYQAFNIGSGLRTSIRQVAEVLAKVFGKPDLPMEITRKYRSGDTRHCFADISRAKTVLGFEPRVSFEDGMAELVKWAHGAAAVDNFEQARAELARRGLA